MSRLDEETDVFTNHNVYVLGAGFSKNAGMPLIKDFLNEMRSSVNWLKQKGRSEFAATREVLLFRKQAASAALRVELNVENIEDLFSLAAAANDSTLINNISDAISATIEYCRQRSVARFVSVEAAKDFAVPKTWNPLNIVGHDKSVYAAPLYDLYAGLLSGALCEPQDYMNNTIITFNYDTVLEDALFNLGVPIDYGFQPDWGVYDKTWKKAEKATSGKPVRVLKIHGSVNWIQKEQELQTLTIYRTYDDGHGRGRVFLIPPTWRKDFSGPIGDVWAHAIQALRTATRIIFIGFSFPQTDAHVKYLLAAGLQDNISLRNIFCINKSAYVKKSFFRMIKRDLEKDGVAEFWARPVSDLITKYAREYRSRSENFYRPWNENLLLGPATIEEDYEANIIAFT